jgi:hypothetical protein
MDKPTAKAYLVNLATTSTEFAQYRDRAIDLIDKPDEVQQSMFGVCGMSAMVRTLLEQADLTKFVSLVAAIFEDKPFNGITAPAGRLYAGRIRQWKTKVQHRTALNADVWPALYAFDFILARALGKLLKVRAPEIYDIQLMTSTDISRNYQTKPGANPNDLFELELGYTNELDTTTISKDLAYWLKIVSWRSQYLGGFPIEPAGASVQVVTPGKEWVITLVPNTRKLNVTAGATALKVTYEAYAESPEASNAVFQSAVDGSAIYQKDGDLALDPTGVEWLTTKVLGVQSHQYTTVRATPTGPAAAVARINSTFDGTRPYAYAFVNGTDAGWVPAATAVAMAKHHGTLLPATLANFTVPAPPPRRIFGREAPVGEHILAITGKITEDANDYLVPVWTWGMRFVARIPKANLAGYLPGCAHGQF